MALVRVVSFDGVSSERMAEMQREMEGSDRPGDVPAKEIIVLHDPDAEKSLSCSSSTTTTTIGAATKRLMPCPRATLPDNAPR